MNINNNFNVQGKFYTKERVRAKKSSIIIMPKNSKQEGSSQIKLSLYTNDISKESLLVYILSLLSRWKEISTESILYRAFYDELEGTGIRIFISFSSIYRLSQEEGEVILNKAVLLFNDILKTNAYTTPSNEVDFDDLLCLQEEQQFQKLSNINEEQESNDQDYSFISNNQSTTIEKPDDFNKNTKDHELPQVNDYKEITGLEEKIKEVDSQLLLNEVVNDDNQKEINNLQVILEEKAEQLLSNEKGQKESKKEIVKLEIQIEEMNYQLLSSERIKNDNQKELVKLEKRLKEASTQLLTDETLQEKIQKELIGLEEQLDEATSQLLADEKLQNENQKELKELRKQLDEATSQLLMDEKLQNESQEELHELEKQLKEVNTQLLSNEKLQNENEIKLVELETQLEEADTQLLSDKKLQNMSQKELDELEKLLDEVNGQLLSDKKLQNENQKALIKLEVQLEEANAQLLVDEKLKNKNQKELIKLETELDKTNSQLLADEKIQSENQKEIIKLEVQLEKANNQVLENRRLEDDSQKEVVRLESELEKVTGELLSDENQEELINLETKLMEEEQEPLHDDNLLIENQEKLITLEVNQHEPTKELPHNLLSMKEIDQWNIEKMMSEQAEFSTNTWEQFYESSQNNYDNIKNTVNVKKIKTQPVSVSKTAPENNVIKPLTKEEKTIEDLFLNFDSSETNKTVSIDKQKYNHYINNIKYLDLRWQNYVGNQLESNQTKFQKTFSTYIEDVDVILNEVLSNTQNKKLNKKKVILNIDDLKIIEAYDALSNYLA
ncbi:MULTISPECIES: hypothetical protein [Vagococcus]|uniref:DNA double-strand break repair Rad50 ATPase n=1 Tax=Vagococcus fluvialis bH819 TaxID=1255619 RepID=A0A1X6WMI7_9ENTE|nr:MULTISPECIES: hypothetical protein [Vagococcus]SLM85479.1 DNA double-strand break repair Rad50 ATPase [Vagococcus fluvialis bH819]HCM89226.1 hypothetical protein [Vagococcus sp.]